MTTAETYDDILLAPITFKDSTINKTGAWRTFRPVLHPENCINCNTCWKFCPDASIKLPDESLGEDTPTINYDYCKGCGICANECPVNRKVNRKGGDESDKAITMHKEVEFE